MLHISSQQKLNKFVSEQKIKNKTVGFVPTLGALHNGHISLIKSAQENCDFVVCSIFVNPTQFDDVKDLEKYPRTLERDLQLLESNNCDVCFTPSAQEVYPKGEKLETTYDIGNLENVLEGATRPGHYQGVCQVVHRLLEMVQPDTLFLGQKDYQQVQVLKKMIQQQKLPVQVNICPIVREEDGLAMSSRNVRLSIEERSVANELYLVLQKCKLNVDTIPIRKLKVWAETHLNLNPLIKVDYIKFCNGETLEEISSKEQASSVVLLGAIFLGPIRIIDNIIIF